MSETKQPFKLLPAASLILGADAQIKVVAIVYGLAIAVLSLAVPLSVQVLVDIVANTALMDSVVVVGVVLFVLLTAGAVLRALQIYVIDLFERRFTVRLIHEIAMRLVNADPQAFRRYDHPDLMNRFFEIMTIRSSLPPLLSSGILLFVQSIFGLAIVSFYHPAFLAFSGAYALLFWFSWRVLDRSAIRTSIAFSNQKYEVANWLENLARKNEWFNATRLSQFAVVRSEALNDGFLDAHVDHFRYTYSQTLAFLALYILGSVSLLVVSGWLVIQGQMTLGQLVAAELILTGVFVSMAGFGSYLEQYYDICAALDKLSYFFRMPVTPSADKIKMLPLERGLRCDAAVGSVGSRRYKVSLDLPAGGCTHLHVDQDGLAGLVTDWLRGVAEPESGSILADGVPMDEMDPQSVRDQVFLVEGLNLVPCSLVELFQIADPNVSLRRIREVIHGVGLVDVLDRLPDGLETALPTSGAPLSWHERLLLEVAFAVIAKTSLIVLTPVCGCFSDRVLMQLAEFLDNEDGVTALFISPRTELPGFTRRVEGGSAVDEIGSVAVLEREISG